MSALGILFIAGIVAVFLLMWPNIWRYGYNLPEPWCYLVTVLFHATRLTVKLTGALFLTLLFVSIIPSLVARATSDETGVLFMKIMLLGVLCLLAFAVFRFVKNKLEASYPNISNAWRPSLAIGASAASASIVIFLLPLILVALLMMTGSWF